MENPTPKALLAICDSQMIVSSAMALVCGRASVVDHLKGINFEDLVDMTGQASLEGMFIRIRRDRISSGVELRLNLDTGTVALSFVAAKVDERFILVGGETVDDVVSILDDDEVSNEPERARCVRGLKARLILPQGMSTPDDLVLDELSRLNNEIVNASRELAKRNRELVLERERERVTISSITDGVIVTDDMLRVTLMNQMAQDLTGWNMIDAAGRNVEEVIRFLVEGNEITLEGYFDSSFETRRSMAVSPKCMLIGRDGTLRPVEDSISPIIDPTGDVLGLVIIFRDITERLRMEQRLMDLNDMMRLINKTMRHDVLNELTATSGALQLYRSKGEDRLLEMAERSLHRCQTLIEELRKLEMGVVSGKELKPFDIRRMVEQVMGMFDLPYQLDGDQAQVLADEALPSVLENIVRNALIHGGTDRIRVLISAGNGKCTVSVMDWGKGIPDEIKTRIFEDGFSYGESGGTGLGLYIVQKVMGRYGGTVMVRDNDPRGTIFDLIFLTG